MSHNSKRYTKAEKLEIVKMHLKGRESVKSLADRFGVKSNSVYNWIKAYKRNPETAFPGKGNKEMTEAEKEISKLKKEHKGLLRISFLHLASCRSFFISSPSPRVLDRTRTSTLRNLIQAVSTIQICKYPSFKLTIAQVDNLLLHLTLLRVGYNGYIGFLAKTFGKKSDHGRYCALYKLL